MAIRQCPSCGASVEVDASVLATSCAFCDSPLVDGSGESEPVDRVAGFIVPKERAAGLLRAYLQGKWLAPEAVRHAARPEALDAVLVPFYAFDALARTDWSARIGIDWYRTETYTEWEDGKAVTRTRQVRETEWFPLSGTHARQWKDHLVSASRGLPEAEANELEPFDLGKARPFAPELTAGLIAEHPTIPHAEAEDVARNELSRLEAKVIGGGLLPGDHYSGLSTDTRIAVDGVRLVLLPVWIAAFRTPKGPLRLMVNGQTGEVVGRVPRSAAKVGCLVAVVLVILVAILFSASIVALIGRLL